MPLTEHLTMDGRTFGAVRPTGEVDSYRTDALGNVVTTFTDGALSHSYRDTNHLASCWIAVELTRSNSCTWESTASRTQAGLTLKNI